jgi:hypothetical protein
MQLVLMSATSTASVPPSLRVWNVAPGELIAYVAQDTATESPSVNIRSIREAEYSPIGGLNVEEAENAHLFSEGIGFIQHFPDYIFEHLCQSRISLFGLLACVRTLRLGADRVRRLCITWRLCIMRRLCFFERFGSEW